MIYQVETKEHTHTHTHTLLFLLLLLKYINQVNYISIYININFGFILAKKIIKY